jgi:hypothetical protein
LGAWREAFGDDGEASGAGLSASTYWLAFEEEVAEEPIDSVFEAPIAESVQSALRLPVAVDSREPATVGQTTLLVDREQAEVAFEELAEEGAVWAQLTPGH